MARGAAPGVPPFPPLLPPALSAALRDFWSPSRQSASPALLVGCAAVGVAGAALVVGHRPGAGLALAGALPWSVAVVPLVRRRAVGDLLTAVLSVALVAVVALRDADWVVALALVAAAGTAAVAATSARTVPGVLLSAFGWAAGLVRGGPWLLNGAGELVGSRRRTLLGLARSLAVTAVLLLVFGALFASADTAFAAYLPQLDVGRLPGQVVVGVLAAVGTAGTALLAAAPPSWSTLRPADATPARRTEWLLPVASLAAMVLAFVLVQVGALLGGHRHVIETAGLTYAQYTRRGFAQLVAATALTLVVVAVAARWAPRETGRDRLVVRLTLGALCVGSLGVVASALRRVDLYVEAFGLTRLRLLVVTGEITMGVILLLVMAAGVRWSGPWLPRAVVQVVGLAVLALAVVNPDAQIVRHNVAAQQPGALDLSYLRGLSADAAPSVDRLLPEPQRSCVLGGLPVRPPGHDLRGWNLGRARAATLPPLSSTAACTPDLMRGAHD